MQVAVESWLLKGLGIVVFLAGIGVLALFRWQADQEPARSELLAASGPVDWVEADRYSVQFGLRGDARRFAYSSRSEAMDGVEEHLRGHRGEPVRLLYAPELVDPAAGPPRYYVYGLYEGEVAIRSYEQIRAAHEADDKWAYALAIALWVMGVAMWLLARYCDPARAPAAPNFPR